MFWRRAQRPARSYKSANVIVGRTGDIAIAGPVDLGSRIAIDGRCRHGGQKQVGETLALYGSLKKFRLATGGLNLGSGKVVDRCHCVCTLRVRES